MVTPSGITSARYSPSAESLKFVCNGLPGVRRFLFEANTIMKLPGGRFVDGKAHLVRLEGLSARYQFSRLTLVVAVFWISIQSE